MDTQLEGQRCLADQDCQSMTSNDYSCQSCGLPVRLVERRASAALALNSRAQSKPVVKVAWDAGGCRPPTSKIW